MTLAFLLALILLLVSNTKETKVEHCSWFSLMLA
jgi:hypothetical protein